MTALLTCLTSGCATPQGAVVLLPEREGSATSVVVTQGSQQTELAQPYAAARLTSGGPQFYQSNAQEVQERYGAALAAQP